MKDKKSKVLDSVKNVVNIGFVKNILNMKKLFVACIVLMATLVLAMLFTTTAIATLGEEGYAVPEESGILQSLRSGEEDVTQLIPVEYEDIVYSSISGYFVGDERIAIDKVYPIYISGGAGLRFLNEENWLISADIDIIQSFEGMYLTDGTTYNSDMTQADGEEFILLTLPNGLYMNAQQAVLKTRLEEIVIPSNSILSFEEEVMRWYLLENESLLFTEEEAVYDATITIGEHTYKYIDLLDALGLIQEAIERREDGLDAEEELNEALEILGEENPTESKEKKNLKGTGTKKEDGSSSSKENGTGHGSGSSGGEEGGAEEGEGTGAGEESKSAGSNTGSSGEVGGGETGGGDAGKNENSDGAGSDDAEGEGTESKPEQDEGDKKTDDGDGSEDGGNDDSEGEEELPGEPVPGEPGKPGEESQEPGKPVYHDPEISLTGLEPWSYAIHGNLSIKDQSNTVLRGVRIAVYRSVKEDSLLGDKAYEDELGRTVYPSSNYEGRSTLLRKTYSTSQELALSTLPPNTKVYVQYSYRYNAQVEEQAKDENGNLMCDPVTNEPIMKTTIVRRNVYSDLVEMTTTGMDAVYGIKADWKESFAVYDKEIQIEALKIKNITNYDAELETFDFENFKKNTLPYVNRLEFALTPKDGGDTVTLVTNTSVLRGAQTEAGALFASSGSKLSPDTEYTYTVRAMDRYGNEIPMEKGSGYQGTLYTRKSIPSVTIQEVKNVTDKLTLKVIVHDPYDALVKTNGTTEPLRLTITDSLGIPSALYGKWANGQSFGDMNNPTECLDLMLENPTDGAEYTFTLESLAFAQYYTIQVGGSYDPQPTGVDTPVLDVVENAILASSRCYTASLSSGSIRFAVNVTDLLDTSAAMNFTMQQNTTVDILPLVDAFRLKVRDAVSGDVVAETELTLEELNTIDYRYDTESSSVVIQEANAADHTPRITLIGTEKQFEGKTLWEAILLSITSTPDAEQTTYSSPVQLKIHLPEGNLKTATKYTFSMESVVVKSGIEYQIPTILTTSEFTTKKIQPKLNYSDFFIAGDVAEFLDMQIYDPDGTIQNEGLVYVYLYYGNTLISVQEVFAVKNTDSGVMDLRFGDMIPGADYTIKFVAAAYNDAEGYASYETNRQLWSFGFQGGSGLSGSLNLESLNYTYDEDNRAVSFISMSGGKVAEAIEKKSSGWEKDGNYNTYHDYYTEYFVLPEDATFIRLDQCIPDTVRNLYYCYFYDSSKSPITWHGAKSVYCNEGATLLAGVPEDAKYVRFLLPEEHLKTWGLQASYYTTPQKNLLDVENVEVLKGKYLTSSDVPASNGSYDLIMEKIPVKEGEKYWLTNYVAYYYFWSTDGTYMGFMTNSRNAEIMIPKGVGYISAAVSTGKLSTCGIYKVAEASDGSGFEAEVAVTVTDTEGYLAREDGSAEATLELFRADSVNAAEYKESYMSQKVTLTGQEDGSWRAEHLELLQRLPAESGWMMTLSIEYQGSVVVLDTITFRTDGAYYTISNEIELKAISRNPFANYLVVDDFTWSGGFSVTVKGTLDFQGHILTLSAGGSTQYPFAEVSVNAVLRNLVVDIPASTQYNKYLVHNNYGRIENLIIRTQGNVTTTGVSVAVYGNYGEISDFILRLGGDLYIENNSTSRFGMITWQNQPGGMVENGYVYGANGAGVINSNSSAAQSTGIVDSNYGQMQKLFALYDSWYTTSERVGSGGSISAAICGNPSSEAKNIYYVGDYYVLSDTGIKNYSDLADAERFFGKEPTSSGNGLWHLSNNIYTDKLAAVNNADIAKLYDTAWQQELLGDHFDAEGCVGMGFYPRLELPTEMQKYQEYLSLPILGSEQEPKLVADTWATDHGHGNESGAFRLRFQNDRGLKIQSVTIEGLKDITILSQEMSTDGLYDVVISANAETFVSEYLVSGFTYNVGSGSAPAVCNYTTTTIQFWKEIRNVDDWQAINDHMDWNYRVAADLDFSGGKLTAGAIQINGSRTNMDQTGGGAYFEGKLDGGVYDEMGNLTGLHTIKGITLTGMKVPSVIYYMQKGSSLTNLVIEELNLSAAANATHGYTGLVGDARDDTVIENVHMRNSQIGGVGQMGMIAGCSRGVVKDCSAADSILSDVQSFYAVRAGGLVGTKNQKLVANSYVRDCKIEILRSSVVDAAGGIVGYASLSTVKNCYATGEMNVKGNLVGGIVGTRDNNGSVFENCWAEMNMTVEGNNAGGLTGRSMSINHNNSFVAGNILSSGSDIHRISGTTESITWRLRNYAYAGQQVTGILEGDADDAIGLLSGEELRSRYTWADRIQIGDAWDLRPLEDGIYPKLYRADGKELLWGQEDITLPGQGGDHILKVTAADYNKTVPGRYYAELQLTHPGITHEQIAEWIEDYGISGEAAKVSMTLDGMEFNNETIADNGSAKLTLHKDADNVTSFYIETTTYTKAMDMYMMTIAYEERELKAQIDYGVVNYHLVPDIDTWNKLMSDGHGDTGENFKITGKVDFAYGETDYENLLLGRLEGDPSVTDAGFYNLNYLGGYEGNPWIEAIGSGMAGLKFANISGDFTQVSNSRGSTGVILSCSGINNCDFTNISVKCVPNSAAYVGFFSTISASIDHVNVQTMRLEAVDKTHKNFAGGFAATLNGSFSNMHVEDVIVDILNAYTGGVFGQVIATAEVETSEHCTFKNIEMKNGYISVGAVVGAGLDAHVNDITIEDVKVTANGPTHTLASSTWRMVSNVHVKNAEVTTLRDNAADIYHTSGVMNLSLNTSSQNTNIIVENSRITGTDKVGGISADAGQISLNNCQVIDCDIICNGTSEDLEAAGGVAGHGDKTSQGSRKLTGVTVRNTTVTSTKHAGGIVGYSARQVIENAYVAEDVVVNTTNGGYAGGVAGYMGTPIFSNIACGATVTSNRNYAGGIIGLLDWKIYTGAQLDQIYYHGDVTAKGDYAGGIIGMVDTTAQMSESNLNGNLVAANVRTPGTHSSLWVNRSGDVNVSPGDGKVSIWRQSTLNGQTLEALLASDEATETENFHVPASGAVLAADAFREEATYTGAGFTTASWDFGVLEDEPVQFMPYVKNWNGTVSQYSKASLAGELVGIPQPISGINPAATAVYGSGVNTLNIETDTPNASISIVVGDKTISLTTDANGVATMKYDFKTNFTIDGVDCQAADYVRKVMTYGNYWYYIDGGKIYYGTAKQAAEKPTVALPEGAVPIHLWQRYVLCEDGSVYQLNGATATKAEMHADKTNLTQLDAAVPFYKTEISRNGVKYDLEVYHDFSMYGKKSEEKVRVEHRLFDMGTTLYPVSPYQNTVYDGVMLSTYNDNVSEDNGVSEDKRYFAVLGNDGEIKNYLTGWISQEFATTGIDHISNNLGYTKPIVLAQYADYIAGYDYGRGELLFTTASPITTFATYARSSLRMLFSGFTGADDNTDSSYVDSEAQVNETIILDGETYPQGSEAVWGDADTAVSGEGITAETTSGQLTGGITSTGEQGLAGEAGELAEGGGTAVEGSIAGQAGGTAVEGSAVAAGETAVTGEGVIADGEGGAGEVTGTFTDGTAHGDGTAQGDGTITAKESQELLASLGAKVVAYDPVKGGYAAVDSVELLSEEAKAEINEALDKDEKAKAEKDVEEEVEIKEEAEEETSSEESEFKAGKGFSKKLFTDNSDGFIALAILAGAGGCLLVVLYVKVIRKRR